MEDNVARTLALAALGAAEEASEKGSYLIDLSSEGVITSGTFIEYDTTKLVEAMNSGRPVVAKFSADSDMDISVSVILSSFFAGAEPDVVGLNGMFQPDVGDDTIFMNITILFSTGGFTLNYEFIPYYCIKDFGESILDASVISPEQDIAIDWSRIKNRVVMLKAPFVIICSELQEFFAIEDDMRLYWGANRLITTSEDDTKTFLSPVGVISGYDASGNSAIFDLKILKKDENTGTVKIRIIGDMKGATQTVSGTSGLVPAPASGKQNAYLKGDGTWDDGQLVSILGIDNAPQSGSNNLVTSGGVATAIANAGVQSDWNQTDNTQKDFIKNKPEIPTGVMRKVLQFELEEAAEQIILDRDSDGNPFELSQYQIAIKYPGTATEAYNAFVYWIQGDANGFGAQGNKAPVVNDSTAKNLMVINGSFDRIWFGIWERYGSIDQIDGRILTNKKCTFVHMYTYTTGMVFPVGTYVELWGA